MNIAVLNFDTIDSTNAEALKHARLGAEEGLCIVARQQSAGRGRHGRQWVSAKDAGIYFSIVLRPRFDAQFLPLITLMAGVAVHDALAEFGIDANIKWVNDLLVRDKKICGILAETTETNTGLAVIVGIGVNLRSSNFPPEIADTATSVEEEMSAPAAVMGGSRRPPGPQINTELVEKLTKFLLYFYSILKSDDGPAEIIDSWRRRSSYFAGKQVRVTLENESVSGITDGLASNGALRLKRTDGSILIVQAGDVEKVRAEPQASPY